MNRTPLRLLFLLLLGFATKAQEHGKAIEVSEIEKPISINNKVYKKIDFSINSVPNASLKAYVKEEFRINKDAQFVYFGKAPDDKEGWAYLDLENSSDKEKNVTLKTNKVKCDAISFYTIDKNILTLVSNIERSTPLEHRNYTNFDFAVPIKVKANSDLGILIKSERSFGLNELNLTLESENHYKQTRLPNLIKAISLILFGLIVALVLLIVGFLYSNKLLISLGFYLLSVALGFTTIFSFHDTLNYPSWLHLNASKMVHLAPLVANMTIFPFLYQISLKFKWKLQVYVYYIYFILVVLILINCILLIFTSSFSDYLVDSLKFYTTIVILIACMEVIKFTYFTKRYYFLAALIIGLGLGFFEAIYRQISTEDYPFNPLINFTTAPLAILFLAFGGIMEMRHELVSKQKADLLLKTALEDMEDIRKEEVAQIGRNLHDGIGNNLASVLAFLGRKQIDVPLLSNLLSSTLDSLRQMSHNFVKVDETPLLGKLESLIDRFNLYSTINYKLNGYGNEGITSLTSIQEQNLYHILLELMNNCQKHSKAYEVTVQYFDSKSGLRLVIEDDGVGFDVKQRHAGIGLINIRKRAKLAGFKLFIDSTKEGTSTVIEISK